MQLGMIGFGRMAANTVGRLLAGGHRCVVDDRDTAVVARVAHEVALGAGSLAGVVGALELPRIAWVMVQAGDATGLFDRFRSREEHSFADRLISAMRKGFGGHSERPSGV